MQVASSAEKQALIDEQIDDQDIIDIRQAIEQMKRGEVIDWKQLSEQVRKKFLNTSIAIDHRMPTE